MTTAPFTDAYLLAYSKEHVAYEVDMFFEAAELRTRPGFRFETLSALGNYQRINSLLIESFVIHFRNLMCFLYGKPNPRFGTDVLAIHFFTPGTWEALRPQQTKTLGDAWMRADKEISHLTTARQPGVPPEKAWDFSGLTGELRPILGLFVAQANTAALAPQVARAIR